ncbi:hypothetical protein CEXT_436751 [Caerostris extrusa]|uniref:Uncharacterized protein n=1 Tax=Caerostris extrusa TaxID=172846 RepID=A0AAV4TFQ7_CAEEX|nr:hypothetical protein CEXT_436751 [Caerostris extrusa]
MFYRKIIHSILITKSTSRTILFTENIEEIFPSSLQRKPRELYQSEEPKASESQTGLSIECATKSKNKQLGEVDKDAVFILSSVLSYLISPSFFFLQGKKVVRLGNGLYSLRIWNNRTFCVGNKIPEF